MFEMKIRRTLLACSLWLSSPGFADATIEEVLVTADFVDKALMKSAGSASVISSEVVEKQATFHLENLLHGAANINFASGGSRSRFLQVRGVGDLEQFQDPKNYPAVGIMLDGIELAGASAAATLLDVQQVEILRGPQGTAYGAAGHAGLVNIQSADPTEQTLGRITTGVGNYGGWQAGAVFSGPVNEALGYRLAAQQNRGDGYISNGYLDSEDTNSYDELSLRGKLNWQIDPLTELALTASRVDSDNGYDGWSLDNPRQTVSDQPGRDSQQVDSLSMRLAHTHYSGAVSEILLHHSQGDGDYGYDADWVFTGFSDQTDTATENFQRDSEISSLELRWLSPQSQRGSYTLGLYARRGEEVLGYRYSSLWWGDYLTDSDYQTDRVALYGQYRLQLNEQLSLTSGLRYENFRDDYRDSNNFIAAQEDHLWSGEMTLTYQSSGQLLVYATLSQSEKPGGINTAASSNQPWMSAAFQAFTADKLSFSAETLVNSELGIKWRSAENRMLVRAALFNNQRSNAQLESWMWDNDAGLWIGYLDSTSDVRSYGAELEWRFDASESVQLFAAVGLLQSRIERIQSFDLDQWEFVERRNRDQAKSPEYQYSVGSAVQFNEQLSARVEFQGQADSYFGYYHDGQLGSFNLLNASLNYQFGELRLNLWGRNLTDRDYAVHGLYFGADPRNGWVNETYLQLGEPRTFGVTASYGF